MLCEVYLSCPSPFMAVTPWAEFAVSLHSCRGKELVQSRAAWLGVAAEGRGYSQSARTTDEG